MSTASMSVIGIALFQVPLDLELDLFFAAGPFVLNSKFGADRNMDTLAGNLDFKALAMFDGIRQAAELGHELGL